MEVMLSDISRQQVNTNRHQWSDINSSYLVNSNSRKWVDITNRQPMVDHNNNRLWEAVSISIISHKQASHFSPTWVVHTLQMVLA